MNIATARRWLNAVAAATALCSTTAVAQAPAPAPASASKPFNAKCAKVEAVNDGDTFRCVRSNGQSFAVRVAAVDAPETDIQRAADVARTKLRDIAVDGSRTVCSGARSHARWVCRVFTPQEQDVGALMIEAGAVWYYRQYASQVPPTYRKLYGQFEASARAGRVGLWADEDPMPPWTCRQNKAVSAPCR
jgi:micrococcal nuclease